jgi:hypothetical protein
MRGVGDFPSTETPFPLCPMPCVFSQQSGPQKVRGCVQGSQLHH